MADNQIEKFLIQNAPSTVALKKTLDAQAARQRAHSQNIANAETPGYQRVQVEFEGMLKDAITGEGLLARTDPQHISSNGTDVASVQYKIKREKIDPEGPGINGVDIDQEMAEMAETQLRYLTALELLRRRYQGMKEAIRGQ